MKRYAALLLILIVVALPRPARPALAQSGGWTEPFEVSPLFDLPEAPTATATATEIAASETLTGTAELTPTSTRTPTRTPTFTRTPTRTLTPTRDPARTATPAPKQEPVYGSSWFPDLAVGPDGSVHVVWYSGFATSANVSDIVDLLLYRELKDGAWSKVNNIAAPATGGFTVRNSIVMGRDGKLHVLLRSETEIKHMSAPWDAAWSAQAWSELRRVSGGGAYYTALGADSKAHLHAFWSESVFDEDESPDAACMSCSDMFYRSSDDGGVSWSRRVNLSNSPDGENRPQVKVDSADRIHVVWDHGIDWYAPKKGVAQDGIYRRSDDGGLTWTTPVTFTLEGDAVQQTTLAVTPAGDPLVVYRGLKGGIYFQVSRDGGATWSASAPVPGVAARDFTGNDLDKFSMAADGAGNLHLVMVGVLGDEPPADLEPPLLLHLVWDGERWSAPETIASSGLYPEWPTIAVGGGNQLHVVWFTRSREDLFNSERAHYRVWYSGRAIDAPGATAPPLYTATPKPAAASTSTPAPEPTVTPLPASVLQAPPPDRAVAWELPGITTVALALVPLLGLFALPAGAIWLLRKRGGSRRAGRSAKRGA